MKKLLFVYGTLKKGHVRQKHLMDQRYLGVAVLEPAFKMVVLGGFPALVPIKDEEVGSCVRGELYEVDEACLQEVDKVEGTSRGLFARKTVKFFRQGAVLGHIPVMLPTDVSVFNLLENGEAEAYVYCQEVGHSRDAGVFWF